MSAQVDLHTRTLRLDAEPAGADRLSVGAELRDVRRFDLGVYAGRGHPAGVVHHMGLDLEIDRDLVIRAVDGWMKTAPFEPSAETEGEGCRHVLGNYRRLAGVAMDGDYAARVAGEAGGPQGCFHLLSLAQCLPLAVRAAGFSRFRREIEITAFTDDSVHLGMTGRLRDRRADEQPRGAELTLWFTLLPLAIARAEARLEGGRSPRDGAAIEEARGLEGLTVSRGFTTVALGKIAGAPGSEMCAALLIALTPVTAQASAGMAAHLGIDLTARARERAVSPQVDSCHMWRAGGPLVKLAERSATKRSEGSS